MDILLTPLRRIPVPRGDVFHAIKASAPGYAGFGEAYFTTVETGAVKGWKRHREMTMNLIVPAGAVEFVMFDGEPGDVGAFRTVTLSPDSDERYQRLTVPPGLWMAFAGRGEGLNLVMNFASIEHRPDEADNSLLDGIAWNWG
jgi:dTDP-4-dehydrorhamnose 3,5-epimerase